MLGIEDPRALVSRRRGCLEVFRVHSALQTHFPGKFTGFQHDLWTYVRDTQWHNYELCTPHSRLERPCKGCCKSGCTWHTLYRYYSKYSSVPGFLKQEYPEVYRFSRAV